MSGVLDGRVAIVTGAGRGIGRNIARAFAGAGATVVVVDIEDERLAEVATEIPGADLVRADLAASGAPGRVVREAVARHGRLDVLVNNARSGSRVGFAEETEETWDATMAVTLRSAFFAAQAAIEVMAKTGGGSIVNMGSIAAELSCDEAPSYHAAKAGLVQITRYLAPHAAEFGVRVNALMPGFVVQDEHRPRWDADDNEAYRASVLPALPLGAGTSDDVAEAALFFASDASRWITGQTLTLDGGQTVLEHVRLLRAFAGS